MAALTRLLLIASALALAGCGVKGALEPPPGSVQAKEAEEASKNGQKIDTSQPRVPDRKLWIDHLL